MAPSLLHAAETAPDVLGAKDSNSTIRHKYLVRKRDDPRSPDDDAALTSLNNKRGKVSFDSEVTIRTVDDETEKSQAVVREEIRRAILRHISGDSEAYDRVKGVFKSNLSDAERPSKKSLRNHLLGLLGNISMLDRSAGGLVNEVLESEWVGRDEAYVKLFVHFLGNLVSAHGGWCTNVMTVLVGIFCNASKDSCNLADYEPVRKSVIFDRVHMALQYILQTVPSSLQVLPEIITLTFPSEHWSTNTPVVYTRNILRLLEYVPQIQSDVLTLITSQLVKIDVHVQVDIEDLDDDLSETIVQEISKRNDEDYESGCESGDDEDDMDSEATQLKAVKTNIIRMDMIIDILFEYYAPVFSLDSSQDSQDAALDLLLSQFHSIILPTSRSRHTQFILFHFAQTSELLIDRFASSCISIIVNKRQPELVRQSAAAYLGSFIARGSHIPGHVVCDVFDLLSQQLTALRLESEPICRGPDLRRYPIFYSVAQALIYMFCFRWRDLAMPSPDLSDDESDSDDETKQFIFSHAIKDSFRSAIYSKLNPLKICCPTIVSEFAHIAHRLRFLYVYPLLETNKRIHLASVRSLSHIVESAKLQNMGTHETGGGSTSRDDSWGGADGESKWQLDAFFPFDPYHLPRSSRWLEGDYLEWRGLDDDDGGDDGDDGGEEGEGSEIDESDKEVPDIKTSENLRNENPRGSWPEEVIAQ